MVRVILFGRLADVAGWRERTLEPAPTSLAALKALIAAEDRQLSDALFGPGVQAAVNKVLVRGEARLPVGAEVAFMPPMSGG